ncbi:MAG: septum formation initiator family protein [Clostridia bacterium]|nr:septum formation initiator family protein [Clostridia bacterium]
MRGKVLTWRGMLIIAGAFAAVFFVALFGVISSRHAMEAQYLQQQQTIVEMERQVAELRNELDRVGTDGYVENEARTRYDYVRNGEIRFEFSDPETLSYYTKAEWEIIMDEELYTTY